MGQQGRSHHFKPIRKHTQKTTGEHIPPLHVEPVFPTNVLWLSMQISGPQNITDITDLEFISLS